MNEFTGLCRFLGRLFSRELDGDTLAAVKGVTFPDAAPWGEAGARWNAAAAGLSGDALEDLAVDYARTFLGAGWRRPPPRSPMSRCTPAPRGLSCRTPGPGCGKSCGRKSWKWPCRTRS